MKRIVGLLSLFAACVCLQAAQSTVGLANFDNSGFMKPIYVGTEGTFLADDATGNIYIQVLGGPDASTLGVIANTLGESVFTLDPTYASYGYALFNAGVGVVPGVNDGGPATLKLTVWRDVAGSTFASASSGLKPVYEATWTQATAPWSGVPAAPSTDPVLTGIPGSIVLGVVPEPSTLALGALGLVALFLRRRQ